MHEKLLSLTGSFLLLAGSLFSAVLHHEVQTQASSYEWTEEAVPAFTELVVSWNSQRPKQGELALFIKLKVDDEWTEYLPYALWATDSQKTFSESSQNGKATCFQDGVNGNATGFSVQVVAKNGATLDTLWALHASLKSDAVQEDNWKGLQSVKLAVTGRSQLALTHPRNSSLCSPSSTAAVTSFLAKKQIDTADFAAKVWDAGFDIYGNWIFNVAEASSILGKSYRVYMARFSSFEKIYKNLLLGLPTVVSVRGSLPGAIMPYKEGHLIAVIGYDQESDCILCMDPAYPTDDETIVSYPRKDFLRSCATRGNIGYFFELEDI